jgi:hypothetical protein
MVSPLDSLPTLVRTLRAHVERRRARNARDATALLVLGALALLARLALPDPRLPVIGAVSIGATLLLWGFTALARGWSPAVARLERRARDVVWVFTQIGARDVRSGAIVFAFGDGTSVTLPVEPSERASLLATASIVFPCAAMGFSAQNRQAFHRDPRSLLGPPRRQPVSDAPDVASHAWLVGPARFVMRRARIVGVLGVAMGPLAALCAGIVDSAAAPGEEKTVLVGTMSFIALVGGVLAWFGLRRFEGTALYRALTTSEGLLEVRLLEGEDLRGDVAPMAVVTLRSGARYTFPVPRGPR